MPVYVYACNECGHERDVVHGMKEDPVIRCAKCDSRDTQRVIRSAPAVRCADAGWEYMNNGRGNYISQMATCQNDPKAYFRSRTDAIAAAKAQGYTVQDT